MTQLQLLTDWVHVVAGVAFWVCFTWPAVVRLFWPWHRDEWGWNMVIKTELIALALFPSVLHFEFGVKPGYPLAWAQVLAVTAIPPVIAWRTWIIYRAQQAGAASQDPAREKAPELQGDD